MRLFALEGRPGVRDITTATMDHLVGPCNGANMNTRDFVCGAVISAAANCVRAIDGQKRHARSMKGVVARCLLHVVWCWASFYRRGQIHGTPYE